MANIDKARELVHQTRALLAERYNVHLNRFEGPVNDLLTAIEAALDEPDPTAAPIVHEVKPAPDVTESTPDGDTEPAEDEDAKPRGRGRSAAHE